MNTGCGWRARREIPSAARPATPLRWTLLGEEMQPFQLRRTVSCPSHDAGYRQLVRADQRRRSTSSRSRIAISGIAILKHHSPCPASQPPHLYHAFFLAANTGIPGREIVSAEYNN